MNYLAHGRWFLDDPYYLAGTALPDWLSVVDRKVRLRSTVAARWTDDADPLLAALARGVLQHHADDRWFHETRAFSELSLEFAVRIRDCLAPDAGFRPSFVGHILVEILLDDTLAAAQPGLVDAYYAALQRLDPLIVAGCVARIAGREVPHLATLVERFCVERFLYDYADDAKLLGRLNAVLRRVGLPALPSEFLGLLPTARHEVGQRRDELLAGQRPPDSRFRR